MGQRRTILMLIPHLGMGGAQRVLFDHSVAFAPRFDVHEACFNVADGHFFHSGNPVIDLAVGPARGPLGKIAAFARRVRMVRRLKRRLEVDVTISHLEGAHYVNLLANFGDRKILVVHGSLLHDHALGAIKGFIIRRLLIPALHNQADVIVPVSRELVSELVSLGVRCDKIHPIHNFFDPAAIRAKSLEPLSAAEQAIFAGPPVLVTSGRLALQKNHTALIAVFAKLLQRRPARLLLLGDGELRQPLVDQARALGLRVGEGAVTEADVIFMGFQDNPFRLQRHADLFVLSSGWEGFPMVLGEAMACGLPIVSADCPTGPREFLAPDTIGRVQRPLRVAEAGDFGMLMPVPAVGDQASLEPWVETLDELLGDRAKRDQMAVRSRARGEDFSRDIVGAQWLALIDELLETRAATSA